MWRRCRRGRRPRRRQRENRRLRRRRRRRQRQRGQRRPGWQQLLQSAPDNDLGLKVQDQRPLVLAGPKTKDHWSWPAPRPKTTALGRLQDQRPAPVLGGPTGVPGYKADQRQYYTHRVISCSSHHSRARGDVHELLLARHSLSPQPVHQRGRHSPTGPTHSRLDWGPGSGSDQL